MKFHSLFTTFSLLLSLSAMAQTHNFVVKTNPLSLVLSHPSLAVEYFITPNISAELYGKVRLREWADAGGEIFPSLKSGFGWGIMPMVKYHINGADISRFGVNIGLQGRYSRGRHNEAASDYMRVYAEGGVQIGLTFPSRRALHNEIFLNLTYGQRRSVYANHPEWNYNAGWSFYPRIGWYIGLASKK